MKIPVFLFRPNKTWVVLGVAVGIGLAAALGARSYLSDRVADLERSRQVNVEEVRVVVAKADLSKGTRLSSDNVAIRALPVTFVHSSAVLPGEFDLIDGQALAYNVKSGEAVYWGLLEGKKVPTFSARVDAGRRAMTVPVDEINSISGLLEPGDLIDLVLTLEQRGKKVTFALMQGVKVMATGQRAVDDAANGGQRLYATVTLDTSPAQAQNIIVAREAGRLTALLRNPGDKPPPRGNTVDLSALLGTPATPADLGVPVLYGGSTSGLKPELLRMGSASLGLNAEEFMDAPRPVRSQNPIPFGATREGGAFQIAPPAGEPGG